MAKIGVVVGSLRKESINRKLALTLMKLAPSSLDMQLIDISQLPLYNEDPDNSPNPPEAWLTFRKTLQQMDGILFVTPEYNRSVPAPLKNAIDVGSRPYGKSSWAHKPAAVISASIGVIGGFGANHHLRQSLVFLDMPCMQQPEAYISNAGQLFDQTSTITSDDTKKFLQQFIDAYATWVHTWLK